MKKDTNKHTIWASHSYTTQKYFRQEAANRRSTDHKLAGVLYLSEFYKFLFVANICTVSLKHPDLLLIETHKHWACICPNDSASRLGDSAPHSFRSPDMAQWASG